MKTLALVVGNNNYYENARLDHAINDAKAMADVFVRLGYDVIYKTDCTMESFSNSLIEFEERLTKYDSSLFYFAGHGFQLAGENYLASIECQIAHPNRYEFRRTCILLAEILEIFKRIPNKINILIVDACRRSFERGVTNTFTPIHAPKGTLIAFSTSPDEGAKDGGFEGHSVYTGSILKYIGRERLSVEELFKKVRKTVYNLTTGAQTTWEHTSLIGDFYFNTGQLVYSIEIPYDEQVVKDANFVGKDDKISRIINDLKSSNWDRQNPSLDRLEKIPADQIDKNYQFLIGRNILQAGGYAYNATSFLDNLEEKLKKYSKNGENHILNGILYEIYFNSNGDFRGDNLKNKNLEKVLVLRTKTEYKKSFEFINRILEPYREFLFYIPGDQDDIVDVDILASTVTSKEGGEVRQMIDQIIVKGKNITETISDYGIWGQNQLGLKEVIVRHLSAPKELVQLNTNMTINKITFKPPKQVDLW